ncbi:MAG: class II aldolase/adducin family protein [Victivallales bacterium]|nr:class II aldolase/adducin family protein [Victivallales bacterium]
MQFESCRNQVAYFMQRLYRHGLTTTSGGNISCRTPEGHVAISASKFDKGELTAEGVGVVTLDRKLLTPGIPLSIEVGIHLDIYRKRPEIMAIVHAHPVTATAFCASKVKLDTHLTAEAYAILGDPVFIPYELMGTPKLAERVSNAMQTAACGLMENHGVITVGKTLLEAFDRLEVLEVAARHSLIVAQLGQASPLTPEQIVELDHFVGRK